MVNLRKRLLTSPTPGIRRMLGDDIELAESCQDGSLGSLSWGVRRMQAQDCSNTGLTRWGSKIWFPSALWGWGRGVEPPVQTSGLQGKSENLPES